MSREQLLKKPDTRREWIKFQLAIHGSSLAEIARGLGVTRQAVQFALDHPYPKVEQAIAEKIGLEPQTIWPERYQKQSASTRENAA